MKNFAERIKHIGGIGIELSLAAFLIVMLVSLWEAKATPAPHPAGVAPVSTAVLPQGGTICMRDDASGSILTYDSSTGAYNFDNCKGFTLAGMGTIRTVNNIVTLSDRKPDRSVSAGFNKGQLTGSAAISFMIGQGSYRTFRINDTTSRGAVCSCAVMMTGPQH